MAVKGKKPNQRRGRERRVSERADARLSMRVEAGIGAGAPQIVTESQNISSSGIYCHSSHYLAPLSKVLLTIVLPRVPGSEGVAQELVKCESIVVRCDQRNGDRSGTPYELACMFTGLEPGLRRRVEEFVTWRNLQALRAALAPAAKDRKPAAGGPARKSALRRAKPARAKGVTKQAASKKRAAAKPVRGAARPKPARSAGSARSAKKTARPATSKSASRARR